MNTSYYVGNGILSNAFPTAFYYFLEDFGLLGLLIEPVLWSVLAIIIYKKASKKPSIVRYCLQYTSLITIVYSVCWWPLYRIEYFSTIFIVIFITKVAGIRMNDKYAFS